ncbi:MAG: hypothetical protein DI566_03765 [Microbacterium sp.]|nr:MAG: hypothetical protein DI566_03765 [Microbacterium sp.]
MKNSSAQSATSLPRAPRDDAHKRMTRYFWMMAVRVVCFVLMVLVQPYGWYTWVFAGAAIVLPYIAVVIANVATAPAERAVAPERAIAASPAPVAPTEQTGVIRIQEVGRTPREDS